MTDLAFAIGRVALVAIFIISGAQKLMGLEGTAGYIASKGLPMPMIAAIVAGLVEVIGGLMIAIGFKARIAALGLAVFTLVATVLFHDFWNMEGQAQSMNIIAAMKNMSIIGGLLVVFAVGSGPYSLRRD